MSTPKWIYFLVSLAAVLQHVEPATQLRLVNGLLIIEDRHPLEVSSSSGSISRSKTSGSTSTSRSNDILSSGIQNSSVDRSALRERNNDLHGHGYLNRNRASSLRHQRRLLKDAQQTTTTTTTTVRTSFLEAIINANPTIIPDNNSIIEDGAASVVEVVEIDTAYVVRQIRGEETPLQTKTITLDTAAALTEKTPDSTDTPTKDIQVDPKSTNHTTAVNSVTTPTMDVITIVWYFSTFIALVAFFVVMVCSDKYCTRTRTKPEEEVITAPATPAPSYREFAPPSYDSVMKKYKSRVFIIPMLNESGELKVPDETTNALGTTAAAATVPVDVEAQSHLVQVEVQKPVSQQVTIAEENSQCKDTDNGNASLEQQQQHQLLKPMNNHESSTGDQLMVVVVLNENHEIKSATGEDNVSR